MKYWNFKGQQNTICEALQVSLPEHAVISVVGAGGKTSLIFAWARELASEGKSVCITTTTHMAANQCDFLESDISVIVRPDPDNPDKVIGPAIEEIVNLKTQYDVVLIEADGARRQALKWPKEHEPVVPEITDISICVAGLSSLGRPLQDALYNAEGLPQAMERDIVDEALIAAIVSSPDGGLKGTYGDYRVFLNQADTKELQEKATYIQALLAVRGIQSAWAKLISLGKTTPFLKSGRR